MKNFICIITFVLSTSLFAQKQKHFLIAHEDTTDAQKFGYVFTNNNNDTILRLDTAKYYTCFFCDTVQYFIIVGINQKKGWWAIDRNEKILFEVYNTSSGEVSPDEIRYGMIRIVDENGKIGFANYKGEIIIKPQFEAATAFYRDNAIIGKECKQVLWCCKGEHEDKHYITKCNQTGYINKKGQIKELGNLTVEQMQKKLRWPIEE